MKKVICVERDETEWPCSLMLLLHLKQILHVAIQA